MTNSFLLIADKGLRVLVSLLTTAILAREMGPVQFGAFYYIISIVSLFHVFGIMGMDTIGVREMARWTGPPSVLLSSIFRIRMNGTLVGLTGALVYGYIFVPEYFKLFWVGLLSLIALPLDTGELYFQSKLQVLTSLIIRFSVFLIGSMVRLLLAFHDASLFFFILSWAAESALLSGFLYLRFRLSQSHFIWQRMPKTPATQRLLASGFPLVVFAFAGFFAVKADTFFIGSFYPKLDIGVYGLAVRMIELIYILPLALATGTIPVFSDQNPSSYDNNSSRIQDLLTFSTWVGIASALAILFIGPKVVQLIFGEQYLASIQVLRIYALALPVVFSGTIRNSIWIAYNKEWTLAALTSIVALILPLFYYLVVPRNDLKAVAWTFVGTLTVLNLIVSAWDLSMFKMQIRAFHPGYLLRTLRKLNL